MLPHKVLLIVLRKSSWMFCNTLKIIFYLIKKGLDKMKFKVGDTVKTEYGVGEIIVIDGCNIPYLIGIKGFDGHSGTFVEYEAVIRSRYEDQCWWFKEEELELVKEENEDE